MTKKLDKLRRIAKNRMYHSRDPIHDIHHVGRVVQHVKMLSGECGLSVEQTQALILAAWWHDVSRTLNKRPSFVIMPFFDDIISALLLWRETLRCGLFGSIAGMSTRVILCKSMGTGRLFAQLCIRKRNRIMIDILHDADMLDVLNIERNKQVHVLADSSRLYVFGYRMCIWWFLSHESLSVKTREATKYLLIMLEEFIVWIEQADIQAWHVQHFGIQWVKTQTKHASHMMEQLTLVYEGGV